MQVLLLFGLLLVFITLSIPIGVALGLSTALTLVFTSNIPTMIIAQNAFAGLDSFPLMAIPYTCGEPYGVWRHIQKAACLHRQSYRFYNRWTCDGDYNGVYVFCGYIGLRACYSIRYRFLYDTCHEKQGL